MLTINGVVCEDPYIGASNKLFAFCIISKVFKEDNQFMWIKRSLDSNKQVDDDDDKDDTYDSVDE